jgi:hypothetical protein
MNSRIFIEASYKELGLFIQPTPVIADVLSGQNMNEISIDMLST